MDAVDGSVEDISKYLKDNLDVDKEVYDKSINEHLGVEPEYELLNQNASIIYVEYSKTGVDNEEQINVFGLLEDDNLRHFEELHSSEQDRLEGYLETKLGKRVEKGLNVYHMDEVKNNF